MIGLVSMPFFSSLTTTFFLFNFFDKMIGIPNHDALTFLFSFNIKKFYLTFLFICILLLFFLFSDLTLIKELRSLN